jgi:Na+-translocating ferredoxin:NAD+ oxidoreductase RnfC subunit
MDEELEDKLNKLNGKVKCDICGEYVKRRYIKLHKSTHSEKYKQRIENAKTKKEQKKLDSEAKKQIVNHCEWCGKPFPAKLFRIHKINCTAKPEKTTRHYEKTENRLEHSIKLGAFVSKFYKEKKKYVENAKEDFAATEYVDGKDLILLFYDRTKE